MNAQATQLEVPQDQSSTEEVDHGFVLLEQSQPKVEKHKPIVIDLDGYIDWWVR